METITSHGAAGRHEHPTQDSAGERSLWMAVLVLAVEDWTRGTLRARREAQRFLFEDNADFHSVCANAGLDGGAFRSKLLKIGRRVQMEGSLQHPLAA